jgi:tetratricopeptide (TPR) repeat protein
MRRNPLLQKHFANTCRRILEERRVADSDVPRLIESTPPWDWSSLLPRLLTCGALETLGKLFRHELARDTKRAHALAELAVRAAESLPPNEYPAIILNQTKAHAWRDLAYSYRINGNLAECLTKIERAERLVADQPAAIHDLAITQLHKAVAYQELGRFDESLALITEAKAIFEGHHDTASALQCSIAVGTLFYRMRHFRESRDTLRPLLKSEMSSDTRAAVHQCIGFASIEFGDFLEADRSLLRAISIHSKLKHPVNILRAQIGYGRLLVRRGDLTQGLALLHKVREDFARRELVEEAGVCAIDIVDALVRHDRPEEAEDLARVVLYEFVAAGLNTRAVTALAYLTEAIANQEATTATVTNIRDYIVSLRTNPERELRLTS